MAVDLESEILEIGRSLDAAYPSRGLHPVRALDERAMRLAAQDQELKAALFRFVDVTPACRSLDDLARHLRGFLDEVGDRPPPLRAGPSGRGSSATAPARCRGRTCRSRCRR